MRFLPEKRYYYVSKYFDTTMEKIRILIADDHAVVREGTRQILDQESDLEVVAEAADGDEAVQLTGSIHPDVVLMDVAMPKTDGIAATRHIKSLYPHTAVLVLSAFDDDQFVFSLLEAGAAGYLLKSVRGRELVEAIRAVHAGESVLHPAVARKVLNHFIPVSGKNNRDRSVEVLSERELDVLRLASKGLSNQEIADKFNLSLRTVQAHFSHIFNKLQVGSRTEAVVRALKEGWVTLNDLP